VCNDEQTLWMSYNTKTLVSSAWANNRGLQPFPIHNDVQIEKWPHRKIIINRKNMIARSKTTNILMICRHISSGMKLRVLTLLQKGWETGDIVEVGRCDIT
jgi:hypothetical protein